MTSCTQGGLVDRSTLDLVRHRHDRISSNDERDPRLDGLIARLPGWHQKSTGSVATLIHAADAEADTIKQAAQPHFVFPGNVCSLVATKDHGDPFAYDGGSVPDVTTSGHGDGTDRAISSRHGERINAWALGATCEQVIANNRAGEGGGRLKPVSDKRDVGL